MELVNQNLSYKDKCGIYVAEKVELIVPKQGSTKKEHIRFSLLKVKKNGRIDALDFSHYFNVGIPKLVEEYKRLGVTADGISEENMAKASDEYDKGTTPVDVLKVIQKPYFSFYGFWWTQDFGGVYRNKETGKETSSTLVFIPCDEDTGMPKSTFCMTAERLNEILEGYEPVSVTKAESTAPVESSTDADDRAAFEEFLRSRKG